MKGLLLVKRNFEQVPLAVRLFLKKALIVFLLWKCLYHLLLMPVRVPDRQLTSITAYTTGLFYEYLLQAQVVVKEGPEVQGIYSSSFLYINNRRVIGVGDPCNGLELYVLYIGFLLCVPSNISQKTSYILLGVAGIFILNTLRCVGIAWLNLHHVSLVNFAHHYLFKIIIYATVFFTWVKYSKKYFSHEL